MRDATILAPAPSTPGRPRRWPRRALGAPALGAALAGLTTGGAIIRSRLAVPTTARPPAGTLEVTSDPTRAAVLVDGRERARTPARLALAPGDHGLTLRHPDALDEDTAIQVTAGQTLHVGLILWRRTPSVAALRPPFPGSSVAGVDVLADGALVLAIALPPGGDHQLWLRTQDGQLRRLGPSDAAGPLAAAPDGRRVAYLAPERPAGGPPSGGGEETLTTVWTAEADGSGAALRYALSAGDPDAHLDDLAWAPDGAHLLLTSTRRGPAGGVRTRLLCLDLERGSIQPLVDLPSEVVPGSYLWDPPGDRLALLTRAGALTSLCLLGIAPPSFRYLADLQQTGDAALPFPPLAWSPDGAQVAYATADRDQPATLGGWLLGARAAPALFIGPASGTEARRLGTARGDAPVWRADGRLLALAPAEHGSGPAIAAVDLAAGTTHPLGTLPVPAAVDAVAVRWDAAHGQAVVAQRRDAGGPAFWLAVFTPEVGR